MAIPAAAKPTPLPRLNANSPLAGGFNGGPSIDALQHFERMRGYVVGAGRIIPCSATSSSNLYTLIPNGTGGEDGESPLLEGDYKFGDCFLFVADAASTGSVTARVALKRQSGQITDVYLDTINVYKTHGTVAAGNGDILEDGVYLAVYAYHLNSNAGGLVLIGV
jgi:hypothetical protein